MIRPRQPGYPGYDLNQILFGEQPIATATEHSNGQEYSFGTDPYSGRREDTDGDGISDDDNETVLDSNRNDPCDPAQTPGYNGYDAANPIWAASDCDADGLSNGEEATRGTDPYDPDSDGDTIVDWQEVTIDMTDPLDPCDSVGGAPPNGFFCPVEGGVVVGNTIVTPDNDGVNDYFHLENIESFPLHRVIIYNRWGVTVFRDVGLQQYLKCL